MAQHTHTPDTTILLYASALEYVAYDIVARWAKEKKDVISMLPYLMRYMGHSSLEKTYYYVHLIPDYFADYAAATENLESLLPEVEPYEI